MQYKKAVETECLTKAYRSKVVLNNLTLSISRGEVVGVLGPNGAGKSTLLRLLIGAIRQTSGSVRVLDKEIGALLLRGRIGYLPEECPLLEFLSPGEMLLLHASLAGMSRSESGPRISTALDRVGLTAGRRIGELSRGMRQRLGIVMATLYTPDLVILDEPTSALDHSGTAILREMIVELSAVGTTVLISSHLLTEIETACSRVIILNRGEVAADGTVPELAAFTSRIDVEVSALNDKALQAVERVSARVEYEAGSPNRLTVYVAQKSDASAVASALVENGAGLINLEPRMETLEELFVRLTG